MKIDRQGANIGYEPWSLDLPGTPAVVTPRQVLALLRRRGSLIGSIVGLCLLGGLAFLLLSPSRYVSTAQIIVDPRALQVLDKDVNPRPENADSNIAVVEDEMRVLKSSNLLTALIDKEDLTHDPEYSRAGWHPLASLTALLPHASGPPLDPRLSVIEQLDKAIAVRRTERSFVIDVAVTSEDPVKSARLANVLVDLYIAQASVARAGIAQRSSTALQGRLEELQAHVREADEKVQSFREQHNLVSAAGLLTSEQRLRQVNDELVAARMRDDEARAKLDQVRRLVASHDLDTIPEALQLQSITHLRDQIADVRRRQGSLADQLGPKHPSYTAAASELQNLERLLNQELRRVADAAQNEYARAHASAQALEQSVESQGRSSLASDRSVIELRELERNADASRALFNAFLARSKELSEQTRLDTTNVRQIGEALPALRRANAPAAVVLLIALVLGLVLGTAAALALSLLDAGVPGRRPPPPGRQWA